MVDRENYRIASTTRRVLVNGTIKGTIVVKERGRNATHRVKYEYTPNSGYGYMQWGASNDVLCCTVDTVEQLCYGEVVEA